MFLLSRLIGISCYCLILLIMCFLISNSNIKIKKILKIYVVILTIMAFFFKPASSADLSRLIRESQFLANFNLTELLNYIKNTSTPLSNLYLYIFGKIGIYGLLPAVSTFIVFSNLFYVVDDYSSKKKFSNKTIAVIVLFLMSTGFYMETISNIRDMVAYSILIRCFYNEFYNGKSISKNLVYYIISILFHASSLLFVTLRFIYLIMSSNSVKVVKKVIYIVIIILFSLLFKDYIEKAFLKFLYYSDENNNTYFYIWEYIKTWIEFFMCSIIILQCKLNKINYNKIYIYNVYIMLFSLLIMKEYNMFLRFNYFNVFMIMPIAMENIEINNIYYKKSDFSKIIIVISLVMLLLSCSRGDLSSLKFF